MGMPKISVIIPALNAATVIGDAVRSVLESSYPAELLEMIVVDDGSTDDTVKRVHMACAGRSVNWQIRSCERGGPGRARNLGLGLSRAEWIQFLDADDVVVSSKLRHQVEVASRTAETVAVIYSTWAEIAEDRGSTRGRLTVRQPLVGNDAVMDLLKTANFIATGSQLFRRSWLERVGGFDPGCTLLEDVDLSLRIAMAGGRFERTASPVPLFLYRRRAGSLSQTDAAAFVKGCVRNARIAETFCRRSQGTLTTEQNHLLLSIYGDALRALYRLDRQSFWLLLQHVQSLEPDYLPRRPRLLRWLSSVVGYPQAEAAALVYRRLKGLQANSSAIRVRRFCPRWTARVQHRLRSVDV